MAPEAHYIVERYMSKPSVTLRPNSTLRDALALMVKDRVNGVVVTDDQLTVVGILSSWDLIQFIVPDYLESDKHLASFEAGEHFASRVQQLAEEPIEKCMTRDVRTVHADASLMEAAAVLSEFRIRQLPVVDDQNKLVGYLNRTVIKIAMAEALGIKEV